MKRLNLLIAVVALILIGATVLYRFGRSVPAPAGRAGAGNEARPKTGLDPGRWLRTSSGDFEESVVDNPGEDGRIRIRAATRGTRDDTVKFLGARSAKSFPIQPGTRISARLDWNHQENGSYLSAALVLSPESTEANPLSGPDLFNVEVIGVPPGQNARLLIACKAAGRERFLHTEGWPDLNRQGRKIALEKIEIVIRDPGVQVFENDALVFESKERLIPFGEAHVYVQMSTHSNYPPREIFFDQIRFPGGP